jgi:hypothetical protein
MAIEHALSVAQSDAVAQPQMPPTHALLFACVAQSVQAPPLVPQAVAADPTTHVPPAQQPPLHVWVGEHDVVHVLPSHA